MTGIYRHLPPGFVGGTQPYAPRINALPTAAVEVVTEDKWHQPLSEPRRSFGITAALATAALVWSTFTPPAQAATIGWFAPLSTPVFQARVTRGTDLVEPVSTAAETVSVDRWLEGLSTPVWPKPGLGAANQAAYSAPPATIDHTSVDRWYQNLASPVWPPRGLRAELQQTAAAMPLAEAPETVTEDRWHQPFAQPYPAVRGLHASQQQAFAPSAISEAAESVSVDRWLTGLSLPVWARPALPAAQQQAFWWSEFTPPPPAVAAISGWGQPLSGPYPTVRGLHASLQQAHTELLPSGSGDVFSSDFSSDFGGPGASWAETVTEDRWHQALAAPVWPPRALAAALQQPHTEPVFTPPPPAVIAVSGWGQPLSRSYPAIRGLHASQQQAYTAPVSEAKETVTVDRWLIGLSTPLYAKASVQAASHQAFTAPVSEAAESVSVDRWLIGLSNPVWARPALLAAQQGAFWWSGLTPPPPLASTISAWGQDLSRPYPAARGLHVSQQQAVAPEPISEAAEAVSIDRWLVGLSLPVWARPALLTADQTAFFAPTLTIDHTTVDRWHASLSLPAWPKPGLNATEQHVYVAPVSEAPETTTVDRWHAAFSLPVWPKRGLYAAEQQYQTAPLSEARETTTVDRWHQPLSIPVRRVATVYPPLPQLIFTAPVSIGWFQPMSVPVIMNKIGLHESFRPPTFFIPFPPFIPSPDREIYGRGGARLIYGKGIYRSAIKGKS
jgi:hypothetical protein